MFAKNLKYYRLKKNLTMSELARQVLISPMAISYYEKGKRMPDLPILKLLAQVLEVKVSDFLAVRNINLVFSHGEFRKNTKLAKGQQDFVREAVEEYFSRFFTVVELLGGEVLPQAPRCHVLKVSKDFEKDAQALRIHLKLAKDGPLDNLIQILENKGILVYICQIDNNKFSGMNGLINGRPYIVLNGRMTPERNRSTLVHELAHLMFIWPEDMTDTEMEKAATAISGAFLFPRADVIRELGIHRTVIGKDMQLTAQEYGISMLLLVKRARLSDIISEAVEKKFFVWASNQGWRTNEPTRIEREQTELFEQLVYRAVSEQEVSIQRGAELLKISYSQVVEQCCFPVET